MSSLRSGARPTGDLVGKTAADALNVLQRRLQYLEQFGAQTIPIVKFRNGVERAVFPELVEHTAHTVGRCTRLQVPLKLAWAITVHKRRVVL